MDPNIIEPAHKKGRLSQERIVHAVLSLIEAKPFDQLTVAEIMEEAGMAVGTFYRRFKTKESVLPFVFQAYEDLFKDWADGFGEADAKNKGEEKKEEGAVDRDEALELIVGRTQQLFSRHAGLLRTVHLYNRLHPDMNATPSDRRSLADLIGAVLARDFTNPTTDDLIKGRMALLTMVSVMTEHHLYRNHSPANQASLRNRDVRDLLITMLKSLKT